MARERTEGEQKAVETILRALAHKLHRLCEEAEMKARRGEVESGVEKGLAMALRELNDMLPRRKRVK